jgi:hypothetical protein
VIDSPLSASSRRRDSTAPRLIDSHDRNLLVNCCPGPGSVNVVPGPANLVPGPANLVPGPGSSSCSSSQAALEDIYTKLLSKQKKRIDERNSDCLGEVLSVGRGRLSASGSSARFIKNLGKPVNKTL